MALRQPPLSDSHERAGASFTGFGGWEMPVSFDSIQTEHTAVRDSVGKFDVSHMGEISVQGPDAVELMGRLTTNDPTDLDPGESQYAMITDDAGIILDDTIVYRRGDEEFLFVPNAGHDEDMAERWQRYREDWSLEVSVENVTEDYAMVAVQGPEAPDLVAAATSESVTDLVRSEFVKTSVEGVEALIARTGYTGEDGFEVLLPIEGAEALWSALECQPCGLGSRDTLRLEMGFLLSGQDFHPTENPRTPFEADVAFTVDLDTEFLGRDALAERHAAGIEERLVGLELLERGVARSGHPIETTDGEPVGEVTSGTMSPSLGVPIALGYVPIEHTSPGTELQVEVRGESKTAKVRDPPFLDR